MRDLILLVPSAIAYALWVATGPIPRRMRQAWEDSSNRLNDMDGDGDV
jgi:hypothetical protein